MDISTISNMMRSEEEYWGKRKIEKIGIRITMLWAFVSRLKRVLRERVIIYNFLISAVENDKILIYLYYLSFFKFIVI